MFKFYGSVNEVESHKKSRQYDLVLEKYWVNQWGWIQLCTSVDMVMTIKIYGNCFVMGLRDINMKN